MSYARFAIVCLAVTSLAAASASAVVIDFSNAPQEELDPGETYSEDGFTFEVISGDVWGITTTGNPPSSLIVGDVGPVGTGDTIKVTHNSGGLFTFDAFDFSSLGEGSDSDLINLVGLVDGLETEGLAGLGTSTATWIAGFDPFFFAPIDELRIVGFDQGEQSLLLDNFVFTRLAVPTPAALPAGLIGIGVMAMRRRRRAA